jgi:hypothetical protein
LPGVGLYLSENYDSRIRGDLCFGNEEIAESLFIEINNSIGKNIIVFIDILNQDVASFLTIVIMNCLVKSQRKIRLVT